MSSRVLLIGHSHAGALTDAARRSGLSLDICNLWLERDALRGEGEALRLRKDIAARIAAADTVISALGGGSYLVLALFSERPFDLLLPGTPAQELLPGAELVPVAAVRAAIERTESHALDLLRAVAGHARGRVVHRLAPPCPRHWDRAQFEGMAKHMQQLRKAAAAPAFPELGSRFLRLWQLMADAYRHTTDALGIECVLPPPQTLDRDGWLRHGYALDIAHGNARYGLAALAQLGLIADGATPGRALQ